MDSISPAANDNQLFGNSVLLEEGLRSLARGWSVAPIAYGSKSPPKGFHLKQFFSRRATTQELQQWFASYPKAGLANITGEISNIVGVDLDWRNGGKKTLQHLGLRWDSLPTVSTPGGIHIYFRYPNIKTSGCVNLMAGMDIRGDGGYLVAPGSIHPNGQKYEWLTSYPGKELPPLPNQILELLLQRVSRNPFVGKVIPVGWRNESLFRACCGFARSSSTYAAYIKRAFALAEKRCASPFPEAEIWQVANNAWKYARRDQESIKNHLQVLTPNGLHQEQRIRTKELKEKRMDQPLIVGEIPKNSREKIVVQLVTFNGHLRLDIRVWTLGLDDTSKPTKKGISISPADLAQLRDLLQKAEQGEGANGTAPNPTTEV